MNRELSLVAGLLAGLAAAPAWAQSGATWDITIPIIDATPRWNPTTWQYEVKLGYTVCATAISAGAPKTVTFDVDFYFDRVTEPNCGDTGADVTVPTTITSGTCLTVSGTVTGVPFGLYRSWAFADARCAVRESGERDNAADTRWYIGASVVDLTVPSMTARAIGDTVRFTGTLCNVGGTTRDYAAGVYVASSPGFHCTTPPLVEGAVNVPRDTCQTVTVDVPGFPPGGYRVALAIDTRCQVRERSETNNIAAAFVAVGRVCHATRDCPVTSYCRYFDTCGGDGVCVGRPPSCSAPAAPVCGCDGKTYTSACAATLAGANVRRRGAC